MSPFLLSVFFVLGLVGCSLKPEDRSNGSGTTLKLELKNTEPLYQMTSDLGLLPSKVEMLNGMVDLFELPSTVQSFSCFLINVTGPNLPSEAEKFTGCTLSGNLNGLGPGVVVGPVKGKSIDVTLTTGPSRTFSAFGIYPHEGLWECGSAEATEEYVYGYHLGSVTQDVFGSTAVSLPISYSSGKPADFQCEGEGDYTPSITFVPEGLLTKVYQPTSSCSHNIAGLPAASASTSGLSEISGAQYTQMATLDSSYLQMECEVINSSQDVAMTMVSFDLTGIDLSEYSYARVTASMTEGSYSGSCSLSPTSFDNFNSGNQFDVFNATSSLWENEISTGGLPTGATTSYIEVTLTTPLTTLVGPGNELWVRFLGDNAGSSSGNCSALRFDSLSLLLE